MVKENHPKKELTPREIQEIELFRQIMEDERLADNTVNLHDGSHDDPHVEMMKRTLKNKN